MRKLVRRILAAPRNALDRFNRKIMQPPPNVRGIDHPSYHNLRESLPFYSYAFEFPGRPSGGYARDARLLDALAVLRGVDVDDMGLVEPSVFGSPKDFFHLRVSSWRNRSLVCVGDLSTRTFYDPEHLVKIEADETALIVAVLIKNTALFEALAQKYALTPAIVQYLLEEDLKIFRWLLSGGNSASRVESYRERAINRLDVHRKNSNVLHNLVRDYQIPTRSYFDVGCLFGLSLVSAVSAGFSQVHGCEIDEKVYKRAREIRRMISSDGVDFRYIEGDLLEMEIVSDNFSLVTVNNVLEHTSDIDFTIRRIADMVARDGVCYTYQGNSLSPNFVRFEPHYKLPLLTLLSKSEAISILMRLGRLAAPEDYVVVEWPTATSIRDAFRLHGMEAEFFVKDLGYWGESQVPDCRQLELEIETMRDEWLRHVAPVLDAEERDRHMTLFENQTGKWRDACEADEWTRIAMLKPTWDIVARYA